MKRSIWHQNYLTLRKHLKDIRIANKLTQVELSKKLGKPQSFVSKYENGDRNLDVIELIQICRAMNVDVINFLTTLCNKVD